MNKVYGKRLLFFIGSLITGIEITRFHARKTTLEWIEEKAILAKFVSEDDYTFNLYHLLTEYLPLVIFVFVTVMIIKSSKNVKTNNSLLLPGIAALMASVMVFTMSDKYYELCKSWFFTHQIAILGGYYFATLFVLKEAKINVRTYYFLLAVLFAPFFLQITQLSISVFMYDADPYFPFGEIDGMLLSIYLVLSGLLLFLHKKKILA